MISIPFYVGYFSWVANLGGGGGGQGAGGKSFFPGYLSGRVFPEELFSRTNKYIYHTERYVLAQV